MGPKAILIGKIILVCILCFGTIASIVYLVKWFL